MAEDGYPIDFDSIQQGQLFSTKQLEEILGVKASDEARFNFAVIGFERQIWERCGFTGKQNENGLFILTEEESAEHNAQLVQRGLRMSMSRFERTAAIDTSKLTDGARSRHDKLLINNGRIIQAMQREMKLIRLESASRENPRLPKLFESDNS